ncbi:protein YIPF6 [Leptopilina boulardi]|uniref:protein YIPF6 n=1 Tax=Leptopilina boulardi TaxID=63433 RepID=UPI0021F55ED9|nr:protein YIPF6 [Leptopilina boulardi]
MATMNEARLDMYDDGSYSLDQQNVEGEITTGPMRQNTNIEGPEFNTLDEPIKDTILRDVRAVGTKFFLVLYPKEKKSLLKEWDLWGPLVLCTFMAMILQGSPENANSRDGGPEFAEVFVIVWIGSMVVTLNSKLLGSNISLFQSVCVLGYCLLPIAIALILCRIILLFDHNPYRFVIRFIISMTGFGWATYASTAFLGDSQPDGRKALAVYPIFLFYFVISWLVISHTT